MTCLTVRKILLAGETPQDYLDEQRMQAERHVQDCAECGQFFRKEEEFKLIMRTKVARTLPPASFRENILAAVADERRKSSVLAGRNRVSTKSDEAVGTRIPAATSVRWKKFVIAATVVMILSVTAYLVLPRSAQESDSKMDVAVRTLVQDHLSNRVREHPLDLQTSDYVQLQQWFASRVDFSVRLPRPQSTQLVGGRLCSIGGQRVVSATYLKDSVPVTLYIMDRSALALSWSGEIATIGEKRMYHSGSKGCNVVIWEEQGLIYGLVSELGKELLVGLATHSS